MRFIGASSPKVVASTASATLAQSPLRYRNREFPLAAKMPTQRIEKAAALGYLLVRNHGFVDGNKRIAHAAMEVFLVMNGMEITASVDEQERFMLSLAAGQTSREALADWLRSKATELRSRR